MISKFTGSGQVTSVRAPYVCDSCGYEIAVSVPVQIRRGVTLPQKVCPECSHPLVLDSVKNVFFRFLGAWSASVRCPPRAITSFGAGAVRGLALPPDPSVR